MFFRIADDVLFRALGEESVILNLTTGTYFGLDQVGTRMWHLIEEHGSMERVVEGLLAEYDVEEKQLRQDMDDLTRQLIDKGLVMIDDKKAPGAN